MKNRCSFPVETELQEKCYKSVACLFQDEHVHTVAGPAGVFITLCLDVYALDIDAFGGRQVITDGDTARQ